MVITAVVGMVMLVVACAAGLTALAFGATGISALIGLGVGYTYRLAGAVSERNAITAQDGKRSAAFSWDCPTGLPEYADLPASYLEPARSAAYENVAVIDEAALQAILCDTRHCLSLGVEEPALAGCMAG